MTKVVGLHINNPKAEMLLTSAGPTTSASQERLLEMARSAGKLSKLNVLRVSDGWTPFDKADGVSLPHRIENRGESLAARLWSSRYIGHVLGKASIETKALAHRSRIEVEELLEMTDMLIVPGGNTWQTIKGLRLHEAALRKAVFTGLPYVGESAGSIVAGRNTGPANLEPADTAPTNMSQNLLGGLNLTGFDVVVHAQGREDPFEIPGLQSYAAGKILKGYETDLLAISTYVHNRHPLPVIALNDSQALSVSQGVVTLI